MRKKLQRGMAGVLAVLLGMCTVQADVLCIAAEELVEDLTADISDGDVNGDGIADSADLEAMRKMLESSPEAITAPALSAYNVYRDNVIDVRDYMALHSMINGLTPVKPEEENSGNSVNFEITNAECCPGEQVQVDVNILDWEQDIRAIELCMDWSSSLELVSVECKGSYSYAVEGNALKLYGLMEMAAVYRGTVATLTFHVPDTAYGDYDVKLKSSAVYNAAFQSFSTSAAVGLIAADVTERPLYLTSSYVNSESLRLSWSMPYCSGTLEGYIVYRDGEEIARTTEPWYYDRGLETGKKYTYAVKAYGAEHYESANSKSITAMPEAPAISAMTFPENASVIGGKSTYVKCSLEKTVDAAFYSLTYTDLQGEVQEITSGSNTAFSTVDLKWNIGDLPSGTYDVTFSVTDVDGVTAEKTVSIDIDTTPPEAVFGFEIFGGEEQIQLTWGIAAEAKVTGYHIYRRTAESNYTLLAELDGRETLEYVDQNLDEGDVYFYMICAVDRFGQEGIYSEEKSMAAEGDQTAPELTLFLPTASSVLSHYVALSFKAEDNIGVASIVAYLSDDDGETWTELCRGKGASLRYDFDTTIYKEASVKVKAVAYDYAGNPSDELVHIYAIDNAGPAAVEGITAVAVTDVTATIGWNDVPDEDFSHFSVKYDKAEGGAERTVDVYTTLGVNLTGLMPDTEYTISVAAVDIYGNYGEYSEPFVFTTASDTTAPVVTAVSPKPSYYKESIPLTVTARDDCNVASITIQASAKQDNWETVAVVTGSGDTFTASHKLDLSGYSDGSLYIRAFAEDTAGNIGEVSAVYEYIVDTTAPEAPTAFTAASDANAIELTWEAYENQADSVAFSLYRSTEKEGEYEILLDNTAWLNYFDRSAEPGVTYYYKLIAIDAAGNESDMSASVKAVLAEDEEAPEIVSVSPADGSIVSTAQRTVSALVSDNVRLSSVTMEYRTDDTETYTVFSLTDSIGEYYTVAEGKLPKQALNGEQVQIRISAEDTAGNAAEVKEVTYTVDNSSTVITALQAEQLEDATSITWTVEESPLATGYYLYKKINDGSWQRIRSLAADAALEGSYSCTDVNTTAGTVSYKLEAYCSNGIVTEAESNAIQVYTAPSVALEYEPVQQANVEYIYDAAGCRDYYGITEIAIDYGDGTVDTADTAASAKFIHKYTETGDYTVTLRCTNEQGMVSTLEQTVEVIPRSLMGESTVTVTTTDGKPAAGIYVYLDLGEEKQRRMQTDQSGKVTFVTSAGIHTIGVFGDGYLPAEKDCTILAGSGNAFAFSVVEEDIVTADFTVERMTLDEIKAAGIDITAAENQHIVEVELTVNYAVHESPSTTMKYYVNSSGAVVGGGGWGGPGAWSSSGGFGGGVGATVTTPVYIGVDENNEVNTVVTLTVPVSASFLKEFFHATLTIYNNADEPYTISGNEVELYLPEGLSLVDVETSDAAKVTFDTLPGQSSKEIDWIIRGDEAGSYTLNASYFGHLDKFNEDIQAEFSTDEPIEVYGASAVSVDVNVPKVMIDNEFIFEVAMTNNSTVDVYCPTTTLMGSVLSSAFGNENSALPVIAQRRLMQDGKYVEILSPSQQFEILEPGYTYSVVYKTADVFAGIDGEGANAFHRSRLDLIDAAIKVSQNSKIPVKLNIVEMADLILLHHVPNIPDYDPETQFVVMATSKHGGFLEGASVTYGQQTGITNQDGYVVLELPEEPATLTVSKSGYVTETISDDTGYTEGLEVVCLQREGTSGSSGSSSGGGGTGTGGTGTGSGTVGNKGDYGNVSVPEEINGDPEDDVNEVTSMPGSIKFGESLSFTFAEDIPLLGGETLSMDGLNFPLTIEVDEEGNTAIFFGEFDSSEDDDDIISKVNDVMNMADKYDELGSIANSKGTCLNPFNESVSRRLTASISLIGALSGSYDHEKGYQQSVAEDGIVYRGKIGVAIEVGAEWSTQLMVSWVPVTIEVGATLDATTTASFSITYKDYNYEFGGKLTTDAGVEVEVFAGVGISGVAAVGAYGSAEMRVLYTWFSNYPGDQEGLNRITFSYDIGLKAYVGPFSHSVSLISPDTPIVVYEQPQSGASTQSVEGTRSGSSLYDLSSYVLAGSTAQNTSLTNETGDPLLKTLAGDVTGMTGQQLAVIGDDLVLVYLEQDTAREEVNSQRLMYRIYDGTAWREPVQVDSNATADYAPSLYTDGETLYLVYQDCAEVLPADADVTAWVAAQDIAAAKYDAKTHIFSEPEVISGMNGVLDANPVVTIVDGVASAAWISNDTADYFGTEGANRLMYASLTENGWTEPEVLLEGLHAVTELSVGSVNGIFCAVYVTDRDNDLTTSDDRTLNVRKYGETQAYEIAGGTIASAKFMQSAADAEPVLYWFANGNICRSENLSKTETLFDELSTVLSSNFAIAGNRLLWCGASGNASNLYESVYDSETGKWSDAMQLTGQSDYLENLTAASYHGNVVAVMNRNHVTITEEEVLTSGSIVWAEVSTWSDLTVQALYYNQDDYAAGEALPAELYLRNNGESVVDTVNVTVRNAEGDTVQTMALDAALKPGESTCIPVELDVDAAACMEYTVTAEIAGTEDADTSDNTAALALAFSRMSVTAEKTDSNTLTVSVTNHGTAAGDAEVTISNRLDGTVLTTIPLEQIPAGETVSTNVNLRAYLDTAENNLTVTVTSETDSPFTDNHMDVYSAMQDVTATTMGDVNDDSHIDAVDASLILIESAMTGSGKEGTFTDAMIQAADVNHDGEVDATDASLILIYSAKEGAGGNPSFE